MLYEDDSSLGQVVIKKKKKKGNKHDIHDLMNNMHHRGNSTNEDEVTFLNKIIDENAEEAEDN